jgi:hypothetical protein
MSDEIITLFSVNITCTEAQAKVLTDQLDRSNVDLTVKDFIGNYEHFYQGGELVIESYESGQPRELGEMIAKWQTETENDKLVSFLFAGQQGQIEERNDVMQPVNDLLIANATDVLPEESNGRYDNDAPQPW